MENLDKIIGENIRFMRKKRNMSQEQVADGLCVSYQQLQKYENGVNRISASMLYKLGFVLKVDINDFYINLPVLENVCEYGILDKEINAVMGHFVCIKTKEKRRSAIDYIKLLSTTGV